MATVLIVDDSSVVRKIARRILEGADFRVEEAKSGGEGLAFCAHAIPDAILVDANMPNIDGYEFVKRLRAMAGGKSAKVVFCLSETNTAHLARAIHAGANEFVLKPFDRERLAAKFGCVRSRD